MAHQGRAAGTTHEGQTNQKRKTKYQFEPRPDLMASRAIHDKDHSRLFPDES
jgi:hypothetical protein